ncbi:MAG: hypothetical protein D6815_12835, partial [Candidatus Dadabacteria bacterium]
LTNTGNETAFKVVPRASLPGRPARSGAARNIAPGGTQVWSLALDRTALAPGGHVAIVRIAYEDANGYPFEVLAATPFSVRHRNRPAVAGRLLVPAIGSRGKASGSLDLRIPQTRGQRLAVRLVLPRGLSTPTPRRILFRGRNTHLRLPVEVRNHSLLDGSRVDAYAVVTVLDEHPPQSDLIHGTVTIRAGPRRATGAASSPWLLLGLALLGAGLLEIATRAFGWHPVGQCHPRAALAIDIVLLCSGTGFLLSLYPWQDLLARTVCAGGDMASLFYPTLLMAREILPRGEWTGWTMGNYAGFPVFHFYSTLPFVVIALLGHVFPLEQTFKVVTLAGPTFLPIAAAWLFGVLGYGQTAAAIAGVAMLPFLLQQGNSMWGGNIPSVLAGEFCHAIGLTLSLVLLGLLHRIVRGRGRWPSAAVVLAAIGLCHTFAFFAALWASLFFVWPRRGLQRRARPLLPVYLGAFLLLCFWGLPLPARLIYTTKWAMIWRIKDWREVLPAPLWPVAIVAAVGLLASLARLKRFEWDRQGLLVFTLAGGVFFYFLVPAFGFPDIRFVPVVQMFLCLVAADTVAWVLGGVRQRRLFAALVVAATLVWGHSHLGYIPSWLHWNYSGYEGKPTWPQFKRINDHLRGDLNDPRVVFEHSETHNRFGSSRAFENLPLFAGRATLEGVFHQASLNSPFIFYLQSEVSERASGPFRQYTYARLDPAAALPHLRLYNVGHIIAVSEKAKQAYDEHPAYQRTMSLDSYAVYKVAGGNTGYVVVARNEPVLYTGKNFKLAFYRWFKHPEMLDVPLVPEALIPRAIAARFALRTATITNLPRRPIKADCHVRTRLEQYRIHFDTDCPGKPHIVKVSYFPRWQAADGSPVLPVSPGFMLVWPQSASFDIVYRRNAIDWIGLLLTVCGIFGVGLAWASPRLSARVEELLAPAWTPVLARVEHWRVWLVPALVIGLVGVAAATRISLRSEERAYQAAERAYRARDFERAAKLLARWTASDKDTFKQATALFQLGIAYGETDRPVAAIRAHERLLFEFPNVNYRAGALFHLARNYYRVGELERARDYARTLRSEYPETGWSKRLARELPQLLSASSERDPNAAATHGRPSSDALAP